MLGLTLLTGGDLNVRRALAAGIVLASLLAVVIAGNCATALGQQAAAPEIPTLSAQGLPLGAPGFCPTPDQPVGWRGDWTGRFSGATPPTQWSRRVRGLTSEIKYLDGYNRYNRFVYGVAASPTLAGRNIYITDDAGYTHIIQPGPRLQELGCNVIENIHVSGLGGNPCRQESFYTSPFFEGRRMYLRGEEYLYCVGPEGESAVP